MIPGLFFETKLLADVFLVEIKQPVGSLSDSVVFTQLDGVLSDLESAHSKRVLIDFCQTPYFGSALLEALRLLWNRVHANGGRMVLCNLSPLGREILELAKFDHLWPIVTDRETALQLLGD
uniref:Anti-sigma factor antagonist n=1 Tax=Schlesneria paludicola TaxID=360056 RepID=A0A7C2P548_9PLAN